MYFDIGKTKAECLAPLRDKNRQWNGRGKTVFILTLYLITFEKDFWGHFFKIMTDHLGFCAGYYPHFSHIFANSSYYLQRELVYEIIRVIKAFRAELFPVSTIFFCCAFSVIQGKKSSARELLKRLSMSSSKQQKAKNLSC